MTATEVKAECPRRHPLHAPNLDATALRKGYRQCKACKNAREHVRRHGGDLQEVSDWMYLKVLNPPSRGRTTYWMALHYD